MKCKFTKIEEEYKKIREEYPLIIHSLNKEQENIKNWIIKLLSSYTRLLDFSRTEETQHPVISFEPK